MHNMRLFDSREGSPGKSLSQLGALPASRRVASLAAGSEAKTGARAGGGFPRSALRAWREIRAQLSAAVHWAFFLDFDGTLVNIRRRPSHVRMPARAKKILQSLVGHTNAYVAIVSGRCVRDLKRLISVEGLHYFGLHGAECDGRSAVLSRHTRAVLERAKRAAQSQLSEIPGIWVEDKGLSFAVHYREAHASRLEFARPALAAILSEHAADLHILNGRCVWEVLPKEIPGKPAAVQRALAEIPAPTAVVCMGDDDTDEAAFAILENGITVRVGRQPASRARYFVRSPADALRLLAQMERELP